MTVTSAAYRENFAAIDWTDFSPTPRKADEPPKRSDLAFPMVIRDEMPATQSMADGKIYDSKSAISAATRRAGCIEIGNDRRPARERPKIDRRKVKETIERAEARFNRGERA